MKEINIGLCIDPVGTKKEVQDLCALLEKLDIRATVTVAETVGKIHVASLDHLHPLLKNGHEIVNHTRSHPARIGQLEKVDQEREIVTQHQKLMELGNEYGEPFLVKGFRAPFYAYDEGFLDILLKLGYLWDSSALYSPLLGVPFRPFVRTGILEIPVLFPDDMTLLDRMLLTPEELFQVWWRSYEQAEGYFIFTIHPYGSARDDRIIGALERFLLRIAAAKGHFLTLSEIATKITNELQL